MLAAIYSRKSTDQNVSDEEKSVTRQVEHARAFAKKKGWTVEEDRWRRTISVAPSRKPKGK